jgi:hypothetical protein
VPKLSLSDPKSASRHQYESVGRSAARHLWVVTLVTILGLVAGAAGGLARSPVYKAQSRLIVGKTIDADNLAATAGLDSAETQIAATYTKLVGTPAVSTDVVKLLGHPISGSLSASAVSQSPVILVEAAGASQNAAISLANAGAKALVSAIEVVNQQTTSTNADLMKRYAAMSSEEASQSQQLAQLQQQATALETTISGPFSSTATTTVAQQQQQAAAASAAQQTLTSVDQQIASISSKLNTEKLQSDAVENQYESNYNPDQQEQQVVSLLGGASPLGSNRTSDLEIALLLGVVGGLIVGISIACSMDIAGARRSRPKHS